ncbi:hypothetical protein [Saliphagus sp. LR7]|uniref:hypothetical protein n=1 Tax=Saliphagus sp. LR7 TaxID=2282654 RepID=UPI0018E51587|nr:hypothetical protein [Saliphagus sp. LR7]
MVGGGAGSRQGRRTNGKRGESRQARARDGPTEPGDDWELSTPVVLPIYDRPETTARVVKAIAAVEPPTFYIVADGPVGDDAAAERCGAARRAVEEGIDWEPEVHRRYRDHNHGVASVAEGLDWVFEREPEAIIVEDDCVPTREFFRFCETMLERYRGDERVMSINGTNRLGTWTEGGGDYHFVTYQGVWGWATWRKAWDRYDPEMGGWPDPRIRRRIREAIGDDERFAYQRDRFEKRYRGESVAWSKPWQYAMLVTGGLAAVPARNLVSNVGFGERAIHTTDPDSPLADLPRYDLEFPLEDPPVVEPDRAYERACFERFKKTGRLEAAREHLERRGKHAAVRYLPDPVVERVKRLR